MSTCSDSYERGETSDIHLPEKDEEKLTHRGITAAQGIDRATTDIVEPSPQTFQDTPDLPADTQEQVAEGIERLSQIDEIKQDNWRDATEEERLQGLQQTENTMAEIQGRPPVEIVSEHLPRGIYGFFDDNQIHINTEALQSSDIAQAVDTIAHEGRHAYQVYAINNPRFHSNSTEVDSWRENRENYLNAEIYGQELYQNQPVEADAWSYGTAIRQGIYGDSEVES